jgi:hypothetical protein
MLSAVLYVKILLYLIFLLGGDRAGGKGVCGRLMSPAHETQSMREIRLLRGRLPRKGGEKSKTHVEAVEVQKSREKAVTKKTTAHKTLMSLKEHTRKDLEIKFRNEKRLCESLERNRD